MPWLSSGGPSRGDQLPGDRRERPRGRRGGRSARGRCLALPRLVARAQHPADEEVEALQAEALADEGAQERFGVAQHVLVLVARAGEDAAPEHPRHDQLRGPLVRIEDARADRRLDAAGEQLEDVG